MLTSELFEKRSNPDRNKKEPALEALEKYRGRNDIFVSFTSDVGIGSHPSRGLNLGNSLLSAGVNAQGKLSNSSGFKIGLNPRNEYNTPTGIYTYPIDYVLEMNLKVPYGHTRPYIMVVRSNTDNILEIDNATEADLDHVTDVLMSKYKADREEVEMYMEGSKFKTPGSALWYTSMLVARNIANDKIDREFDALHKYDFPEKPSPDSSDEALVDWQNSVREIYRLRHNDKKKFMDGINVGGKRGAIWNRILRDCGYDCIIDNGSGTIHPNESTQAVFLKGPALKLVEVINNNREIKYTQLIYLSNNPEIATREITRGNMRREEISKLLSYNFSLLPKVIRYLKKNDVIQVLKDNPEMFQKNLPEWVRELYVELPESFNQNLSLDIEKDVVMRRIRSHPSFWRHVNGYHGYNLETIDPLTQRVVLKNYPRELTTVDNYSLIDKQAFNIAMSLLEKPQQDHVKKWAAK